MKNEDGHDGKGQTGERTPFIEWVVTILGIAFAVGSIGFMAYLEISIESSPPAITVTTEKILKSSGNYLVLFVAQNNGGTTGAKVVIAGRLTRGEENETKRVVIDYIPPYSKRKGGLYFSHDPRSGSLHLAAEGYQQP